MLQNELDKVGFLEVVDGVYLHTQESLLADQLEWDESDEAKHIDLTQYNYWISTNSGTPLEGVNSAIEGFVKIYGEVAEIILRGKKK